MQKSSKSQSGRSGGGAEGGTDDKRRPVGYWATFNQWWRDRLEEVGCRPSQTELAEWFEQNAAGCWRPEEMPSLKEVRTHAKCLRSTEQVRQYFRRYRAQRKANSASHRASGSDSESEDHAPRWSNRATTSMTTAAGRSTLSTGARGDPKPAVSTGRAVSATGRAPESMMGVVPFVFGGPNGAGGVLLAGPSNALAAIQANLHAAAAATTSPGCASPNSQARGGRRTPYAKYTARALEPPSLGLPPRSQPAPSAPAAPLPPAAAAVSGPVISFSAGGRPQHSAHAPAGATRSIGGGIVLTLPTAALQRAGSASARLQTTPNKHTGPSLTEPPAKRQATYSYSGPTGSVGFMGFDAAAAGPAPSLAPGAPAHTSACITTGMGAAFHLGLPPRPGSGPPAHPPPHQQAADSGHAAPDCADAPSPSHAFFSAWHRAEQAGGEAEDDVGALLGAGLLPTPLAGDDGPAECGEVGSAPAPPEDLDFESVMERMLMEEGEAAVVAATDCHHLQPAPLAPPSGAQPGAFPDSASGLDCWWSTGPNPGDVAMAEVPPIRTAPHPSTSAPPCPGTAAAAASSFHRQPLPGGALHPLQLATPLAAPATACGLGLGAGAAGEEGGGLSPSTASQLLSMLATPPPELQQRPEGTDAVAPPAQARMQQPSQRQDAPQPPAAAPPPPAPAAAHQPAGFTPMYPHASWPTYPYPHQPPECAASDTSAPPAASGPYPYTYAPYPHAAYPHPYGYAPHPYGWGAYPPQPGGGYDMYGWGPYSPYGMPYGSHMPYPYPSADPATSNAHAAAAPAPSSYGPPEASSARVRAGGSGMRKLGGGGSDGSSAAAATLAAEPLMPGRYVWQATAGPARRSGSRALADGEGEGGCDYDADAARGPARPTCSASLLAASVVSYGHAVYSQGASRAQAVAQAASTGCGAAGAVVAGGVEGEAEECAESGGASGEHRPAEPRQLMPPPPPRPPQPPAATQQQGVPGGDTQVAAAEPTTSGVQPSEQAQPQPEAVGADASVKQEAAERATAPGPVLGQPSSSAWELTAAAATVPAVRTTTTTTTATASAPPPPDADDDHDSELLDLSAITSGLFSPPGSTMTGGACGGRPATSWAARTVLLPPPAEVTPNAAAAAAAAANSAFACTPSTARAARDSATGGRAAQQHREDGPGPLSASMPSAFRCPAATPRALCGGSPLDGSLLASWLSTPASAAMEAARLGLCDDTAGEQRGPVRASATAAAGEEDCTAGVLSFGESGAGCAAEGGSDLDLTAHIRITFVPLEVAAAAGAKPGAESVDNVVSAAEGKGGDLSVLLGSWTAAQAKMADCAVSSELAAGEADALIVS